MTKMQYWLKKNSKRWSVVFPATAVSKAGQLLPCSCHPLLQRLEILVDFEPTQNSGFQTLPSFQPACKNGKNQVFTLKNITNLYLLTIILNGQWINLKNNVIKISPTFYNFTTILVLYDLVNEVDIVLTDLMQSLL